MCISPGAGGGPGGPQLNYNPLAPGSESLLKSGISSFPGGVNPNAPSGVGINPNASSDVGIDPTAGNVSIPDGSGGGGSTRPAAPTVPEVAREAGRSGAGRGARFSKFNRATILGGARGLGEGARVDRKSLLGA